MTGSDYVGIATLITAFGAAVVSIIVALKQREVHTVVTDVAHQLETPNGSTVGEIIAGNDPAGVQEHTPTEVKP